MDLSKNQKKELLQYSRSVLSSFVNAGKKVEEEASDSLYLEKCGVFVSLHKGAELRGCIGYIEPVETMWDAIAKNTIAAASNDFRFNPVEATELPEIEIEISILTPMHECNLDEINAGQDGVVIQQGPHKATYLPQVWESMPNKEDFFSSLCQKANLPNSCWQSSKTKFYKYQAIVFKEKDYEK